MKISPLSKKRHYHEMSKTLSSWDLNPRQLCDLELLLNGTFLPLKSFLNQVDYDCVVKTMRLSNGQLWPLPITLDIDQKFSENLKIGQKIALRDEEGVLLALMTLESIWTPDKLYEAEQVFGSSDTQHPAVKQLLQQTNAIYISGDLECVELPLHYDYRRNRHTPEELKAKFQKLGWRRIVAYHSHEPMHRLEQNRTFQIARELEANLLIHPSVGFNPFSCFDHFLRVRCYQHVLKQYPNQTTLLSLLNLSIRMAGPREALLHALIHKNYACSHFIINDQHSCPKGFYSAQASLTLVKQYESEIGLKVIGLGDAVYIPERAEYLPRAMVKKNETTSSISQPEFLRRLQQDLLIPDWFSYPDILDEIRTAYPPRHQQGITIFFTGLSGSGKSTVANALQIKLLEKEKRPITLLDGDIVRKNLSSELTFSKTHRDLNILRIGFVASEITKNGGIAICAPIAPYQNIRQQVRESIEAIGGYIEIHISTPIEECERRDRKGLYAKARAGLIQHFTGVNDPYEIPEKPDLRLDTTNISPNACAHQVLLKLEQLGFLKV
jgi:sulfate adenylyltransferase